MIDIEELFFDLKKIVKKAGSFLLSESIEIEKHKNVNDLLTKNDIETETYILKLLKSKYPDINIISEELNAESTIKDVTVVIDPIDGTCNYAAGLDLFGIQVAIFNEKEVIGNDSQCNTCSSMSYRLHNKWRRGGDRYYCYRYSRYRC